MSPRATRILAFALCCGLAVPTAACGVGPDKSREDAHDTTDVDKTPPRSLAFNNHYSNVETKCDGFGHRVFVTTSKSVLVVADPSCPGWTEDTAALSLAGTSTKPAE